VLFRSQDPRWRQLPVIAMTANALLGDRDKALEAGMNDHVAKPIDVEALYRTLARWLSPKPATGQPGGDQAAWAEASTLDSLPGIDTRSGLGRTLGNEALYRRMLGIFAHSQDDFVDLFRQAWTQGDLTTAKRLVHTLQSVAATIGAEGIAQAGTRLDERLASGHEQAIEEALALLDQELKPVIAGLLALR